MTNGNSKPNFIVPTGEFRINDVGDNRTSDERQPQHLTFLQFCEHAHIVPLKNHGRAAEVFFRGASLGFVEDAGVAGLMQAHQRQVNNALYAHSGDAPDFLSNCELPCAAALADYPAMRAKFPEACRVVDAAIGASVAPRPTQLCVRDKINVQLWADLDPEIMSCDAEPLVGNLCVRLLNLFERILATDELEPDFRWSFRRGALDQCRIWYFG